MTEMILQALTKYYDILAKDAESGISLPGYCTTTVSFVLSISESGELKDIVPLSSFEKKGKKTVENPYITLFVPAQIKRTNRISANFLCDSVAYVLGFTDKNMKDPNYSIKCHKEFCDHNIHLLENIPCKAANAVINFLQTYDPIHAKEYPQIDRYWTDLCAGRNIVFRLEGNSEYVHEDTQIRDYWEKINEEEKDDVYRGQCLVTGKTSPIAILHNSIMGLPGSNPTGATLVGFNADAYESYGRHKQQGKNSPVSERAAFAYTTVLNFLLSKKNPNRKFTVGDTSVVYWAESPKRDYANIFSSLFQINWADEQSESDEIDEVSFQDKKAEQRLSEIGEKITRGDNLDSFSLMEGLDPKTRFYILGLAPNAARASIRFFHQDPFEKIVKKIILHYEDLQIVKEFADQPNWIPLYRLLGETYSKKSSEKKSSPLLSGAVMRSILNGTPYPAALYYAIINRIRADVDDKSKNIQKINYFRAAIVKAYLLRKYRSQKNLIIQEVLCMSLNQQTDYPAYLLGRLFAVLEKTQKDAIPNLNTTIKDRYFTTACASPASVFPILLRLSQHHISKSDYGYWSEQLIQEIMSKLKIEENAIPHHLSLDDQGIFILGYYHQRADFFEKKSDDSKQIEKIDNGDKNE